MGVTRNEFLDAYEYDGQYYENYEDIPFATKKAYETVVPAVGNFAKKAWQNELDQPITGHVLKGAVWAATKTFQYIDKESMGGISGALGLIDKGFTKAADAVEYHTGLYSPTAKIGTELAFDYALTGGGGKAVKTAKALTTKADNFATTVAKNILPEQQLAYETVPVEGLFTSAVRDATSSGFKPNTVFASTTTARGVSKVNQLPPSVKDVQIARKFKGDSKFVEEISAKTSRMKDLINKTADKRGHADLSKYRGGDDYIITPKGERFRYMWKDGRYSWRSMTSEGKRALKRLTGEGADLKSIEPLFKKHFNPTQAKEASALYVDTQRVVNSKIKTAIREYNKTVPDSKHLSLEHIFDVKFYDNIKKDVPAFSGRGANELGNITALNKVENMRTGALNRKVDTWDAFLGTIRKDKGFPDYDKVISQFIYEDVGNVVANFTKKDWDEFIEQFLTRQGDTAQEIIIEMARKRN